MIAMDIHGYRYSHSNTVQELLITLQQKKLHDTFYC
jgi:hypothetical protein